MKLLSKISHKNIIKYETALKTKIHYYIIMEYCNGGTLRENLEKYKIKYGKPIPVKIIQHIIKQLIDVINYIFDNNIIIYDLSLDNINLNYYTEEAKDNLDKLLKLKPKDYKNISKKEKDETQFVYMYQKSKRMTVQKSMYEGSCILL